VWGVGCGGASAVLGVTPMSNWRCEVFDLIPNSEFRIHYGGV
jgi:hypothetical protein